MERATIQQTAQTDNELVDDILNEIQSSNVSSNPSSVSGTNPSTSLETSAPHATDDQTKHALQPSTAQDLTEFQNKVSVAESNADANALDLSEGERLLRNSSTIQDTPKSFWETFDVIQFAKTLLLTMILFILVTNTHTQTLLCKLPYVCTTTLVDGVSKTQLNFIGTVLLAFVSGTILASVQAFV
jgi:hypothetical protein